MKLFLQKNAKFSSAGGSAPRPPCLRRLGALPSNPGPHWPPAAGGSAPRPPNTAPHCEFLATRLGWSQLTLREVELNKIKNDSKNPLQAVSP